MHVAKEQVVILCYVSFVNRTENYATHISFQSFSTKHYMMKSIDLWFMPVMPIRRMNFIKRDFEKNYFVKTVKHF